MASQIRSASHAGSWYSGSEPQLRQQLQKWLGEAAAQTEGQHVRAVIAPHAGYTYSGPTAAWAYANVAAPASIRRVFVLGPSHHVYLEDCALPIVSACQTPFGLLRIDQEVVAELQKTGEFGKMSKEVDEDEHSIEMHLPYIHHVLKEQTFTIVPILVGSLNSKTEALFGRILAPYFDNPENFFVFSSDFCHWGKRFRYTHNDPSKGPIHKSIEALDMEGVRLIEQQNCEGFAEYLKRFKNTICGRHPIGILLQIMRFSSRKYNVRFARYAQSSQVVSESDSSVSYCSIVVSEKSKE